MRLRTTAALITTVLAVPLLPACAPAAPVAQAPRSAVADPGPADAPAAGAIAATTVSVTRPKEVPAELDCAAFLPALVRATGIDVAVRDGESTAELCRYALPYNRGITTASIFFRAEPPGTPSYQRSGEMFGNTAYQVDGSAGKDCGLSVALDAAKDAHEHGSHLTVLGTYEAVDEPCVVTRRITEIVFDGLPDA